MSLLTGEPRSATVQAATDLSVIAGSKSLLQVVQEEDRRLIERIGEVGRSSARRHGGGRRRSLSRDAAALSVGIHAFSERIQKIFLGRVRRSDVDAAGVRAALKLEFDATL